MCFIKNTEHINNAVLRLEYTEEAINRYKNPDNDLRGNWMDVSYHGPKSPIERPNLNYPIIHPKTGIEIYPKEKSWAYEKTVYEKHKLENRLWWGKDFTYSEPRLKKFLTEMIGGLIPKSLLTYKVVGGTSNGRDDLRQIFNDFEVAVFDNPKPRTFISKLLQIGCSSKDICLDFFSGSGTTAHAVLDLNKKDGGHRKFILIQLPEKTDENSEAFKAGYKTIADIGKERIRRVIKKIEEERKPKDQQQLIKEEQAELDLGFKVFKLKPSNFKQWQTDIQNVDELEEQLDAFTDPVKPEAEEENMFYELLLKSGYDLTSKIVVKDLGHGTCYYDINDGNLVLQLSGKPKKTVESIIESNPKKVIMLDRLFENNDQLKTNTYLQFKNAGVDFRTV